jgi:hypothetical protein
MSVGSLSAGVYWLEVKYADANSVDCHNERMLRQTGIQTASAPKPADQVTVI